MIQFLWKKQALVFRFEGSIRSREIFRAFRIETDFAVRPDVACPEFSKVRDIHLRLKDLTSLKGQ